MRPFAVMLAGAFMLAGSIAHTVGGWPPLATELISGGITPDLIAALAVGWYFGSGAMAWFGLMTIDTGRRMRRGEDVRTFPVLSIAVGYLLFAIAAFLFRSNMFFLTFAGIGLLAGLPMLSGGEPADRRLA